MTMRPHPATFSKQLVAPLVKAASPWAGGVMLDPFAGIGKGARIAWHLGCEWIGLEIEPEWAIYEPRTICADSTHMPLADQSIDVVVTSPAYGNRMADSYGGSPADHEHFVKTGRIRRRTYRIALGRPLSPNNGGGLHWGEKYRELHQKVWGECFRVLRSGGGLILNVSDHIRKTQIVPVTAWHTSSLNSVGFRMCSVDQTITSRYKEGQNGAARLPHEYVITFVKP